MKWSEHGSSKDFEQAPTGAQVARCIKMIDIGTQVGEWQGKPKSRRQVIITFELPNCLMTEGDNEGKPFIVSKFYTASLGEKASLRHDLVAWRGREFTKEELAAFDAKNIMGKTCMLGLINKEGKTRIGTVMQLPKGMPIPDQINQTVFFSLDEFNQSVFDSLSDGIKKMVELSPEYKALKGKTQSSGFDDLSDDKLWDNESHMPVDDEDIPF